MVALLVEDADPRPSNVLLPRRRFFEDRVDVRVLKAMERLREGVCVR